MKVRIVRGLYGSRKGLKSPESGAFELNDTEAERIISLGIAEAVSDSEADDELTVDETIEDEKPSSSETPKDEVMQGHFTEEDLKVMQYNDLRKLAKDLGVDTTGKQSDIIARILAVDVAINTEDSSYGELEAPVLEAAVPV